MIRDMKKDEKFGFWARWAFAIGLMALALFSYRRDVQKPGIRGVRLILLNFQYGKRG
jgi:hypothetical protein